MLGYNSEMLELKKRFTVKAVGFAILTCSLLSISAFVLYQHFSAQSAPQPLRHTARLVNFPLYYPAALPAGYIFDSDSLSSTTSVVLFSLHNPSTGDIISISEQPTPSTTLDLNTFYHNQFDSFNDLTTPAGKGIYGKDAQNATISILSSKTWLIIRAPLTSGSQIKTIALKLAKL